MPVQPRVGPGISMPQGLPTLTNAPTPFAVPGEIGAQFFDQNTGCVYRRLILDSGATSATTIGVVKAGQLAFWKDESNNLITNDYNFNDTGTPANAVNRIAGIFQTAVTAAPAVNNSQGQPIQYVCDVLVNGKAQNVLALAGSTCVPGYQVIADTTANMGSGGGVKCLATATTAPTQQVVGVCRSSAVAAQTGGGFMLVDVAIGFVD